MAKVPSVVIVTVLGVCAIVAGAALGDDSAPSFATGPLRSLAFSQEGKYVIFSAQTYVQMWNLETGRRVRYFQGHFEPVHCVALSRDGNRALSGGGEQQAMTTPKDTTARLWNVESGVEMHCFRHKSLVFATQFSPDGRRALTVSKEGIARVWDAESLSLLFQIPARAGYLHFDLYLEVFAPASFSPDGRTILSRKSEGKRRVIIWDAKTGGQLGKIDGHEKDIRTSIFSPSGKFILTASQDRTARSWNSTTGEQVCEFRGHEATVTSAVFQADESRVVTASDDRTARLWDARTGKELRRFQHREPVNYALISADGARILTKWERLGRDLQRFYYASLWDAESGTELKQIELRSNAAIAVFTPDTRKVLLTAERTMLLDAESGDIIRTYD